MSAQPNPSAPAGTRPARARPPARPAPRLLALVAAVLAVHAWLVAQWMPGDRRLGSGHGPAPRPMLLVPAAAPVAAPRLAVATAVPAALPAPPTLPAPAAPAPAPATQQPVPPRPADDGARALDAQAASPGDAVALVPALAPRPAAVASQAALEADPEAESSLPPPPAEGAPPPVYATRIPLPVLLRYQVVAAPARGPGTVAASAAPGGEALLQFRHDGQRYTLQLDARADGRPLIEQRSVGGFDTAGLAPERFTDRRRGRGAQAANFRRDAGRIGFSGPRIDYPLLPGTQDRLSVLAQLAAIAAAGASGEATAAAPARLQTVVVDARGWAEAWDWQFDGHETVDTPLGALTLAHWRREPARPEGLRVEAWIDPARGHWPARLRTTLLRNGQVLDLRLAAEPAAPP